MKKMIFLIICVLSLIFADNLAWATAKVTFSLQNRRVSGNVYYAEVWADVSGQWVVSGQTIQLSINTSALQGNSYVGNPVMDADAELSSSPYNAMNFNWFANRASLAVVVGATPPFATKTGSFRLGTLRFTVLNSALMDNISFVTATSGITTWTTTLTPLMYGCNDSTCYQVISPTSVVINTLPSVGTPTLVAPVNNATSVSLQPQFSWNPVTGASSYTLQVSTVNTYATTVVNQASITTTNHTPASALSAGVLYYWRVNATNGTQTGSWSETRSFTTAAAAPPSAPILLSPTNEATGQSTSPTLSWNASTGASSYNLQVSTSNTFANTITNLTALSATSQAINGLSAGTTYYWRVSATNANGTSAWSAVWNFSTNATAPPSAPILLSPTNGATQQSTSPTLSWNASTGASSYNLQVSTSNTFANTITNLTALSATSQTINGLSAGTTYYWRVSATNANGTSAWSAVWSFSTNAAAPPSAPVLISPADAATNTPVTPTLEWSASVGATAYNLQVSVVSNFASTIVNQNSITATSQVVAGLSPGTLYYWRVSATNANGTSAWSASRSFTTSISDIGSPVLVTPENNSTNISLLTSFLWTAVTGASSYTFQLSSSPTFQTFHSNQEGITNVSFSVSGMAQNTAYYWRVRAVNGAIVSAWSPVSTFTTLGLLAAPVLVSPENGATQVQVSSSVEWNLVQAATNYQVQISTNNLFSNLVVDQSTSSNYYSISSLSQNTTYYWRVRAYNASNTSVWSSVRSFSTGNGSPLPPTLISPTGGATSVSLSPTFSWSSVTNAITYNLQVSTSNTFSNTIINQSGIAQTTQIVNSLLANTVYYWRVSATNTSGTSAWSSVSNFTTETPTLPAPELLLPENFATGVATNATLYWNGVSGATTYSVQVSTSNQFTTFVFNQSGITSTSFNAIGLTQSTTYYWRVNASNGANTGSWSVIRSFTTGTTSISAPNLLLPLNNATNLSLAPALSWTAVLGATSYSVQVSLSNQFTSFIYNQSGITANTITVSGLANGTTYYWRVNAGNSTLTSDWSSVRSFTTTNGGVPDSWSFTSNTGTNANIGLQPTGSFTIGQRSFQTGDAIGAFYSDGTNLKCAGYLIWNGSQFGFAVWGDDALSPSKDGFSIGEAFTFRVWDATNQVEIPANVTYLTGPTTFQVNGLTVLSAIAANTSTTQNIPLSAGWNMVSSYVNPTDNQISSITSSIASNLVIIKNSAGESYWLPYMTTLSVWNPSQAYAVKTTAACTLAITGTAMQPNTTPIYMPTAGWYWIPYYRNSAQSTVDALSSIAGSYSIVKSIGGEAYWPPYMNTLTQFVPGAGYIIYMNRADTLTYSSNSASTEPVGKIAASTGYARKSTSVSMNAALDFGENWNGSLVGIFNNYNEEIASAVVTNGITAFTLFGDDPTTPELEYARNGEHLYARIVLPEGRQKTVRLEGITDVLTNSAIDNFTYGQNSLIVAKAIPGDFVSTTENTGSDISAICTPNPVLGTAIISLNLASEGEYSVELISIDGQRIALADRKVSNSKSLRMVLDAGNLSSGVYTLVLRNANQSAITKIVVVK